LFISGVAWMTTRSKKSLFGYFKTAQPFFAK